MNGKLAVNIDEEALFEVLVGANFAAPASKLAATVPAAVIESTTGYSWIFHRFPSPGYCEAGATTSCPF